MVNAKARPGYFCFLDHTLSVCDDSTEERMCFSSLGTQWGYMDNIEVFYKIQRKAA